MTANTGNTGNTANTGNTGNAGIVGDSGWFIPDRIDFPFITELHNNAALGTLRRTGSTFQERNWSARWFAWRVLKELLGKNWSAGIKAQLDVVYNAAIVPAALAQELTDLANQYRDERPDAMGEILSQDVEFITFYMTVLGITPGGFSATYRLIHVASQIGLFAALYYKDDYKRVRPSQICPALLPPIALPGHPAFPSGHATQAHLIARCLEAALSATTITAADQAVINADLQALARRISRNREIAGLHYASDSAGGALLAGLLFTALNTAPNPLFSQLITDAAGELK